MLCPAAEHHSASYLTICFCCRLGRCDIVTTLARRPCSFGAASMSAHDHRRAELQAQFVSNPAEVFGLYAEVAGKKKGMGARRLAPSVASMIETIIDAE